MSYQPQEERIGAETERSQALCGAWAREAEADRLLRMQERDPNYPAYTEKQLTRKGQGFCVMSVEDVLETALMEGGVSESFVEEIRFLMTVTALTNAERCVVEGWLAGCTQTETQNLWRNELNCAGQQHVSRLLRRALGRLLDVQHVSFRAFSRHTIYRRPTRRRVLWRERVCRGCGEPFVYGLGEGAYCSQFCREAAQSRRRSRR